MNVLRARFGKCLIPGRYYLYVVTRRHVNTEPDVVTIVSEVSGHAKAQRKSQFALERDFLPCPAPATFDLRRTQPATGQSEKMEKNRKTGN